MHRLFYYTSTGPVVTPVLVHHAFGVKEGECIPILHVRHDGGVMHPETPVRTASAPTVGEHLQERVLVYGVVPFAQPFGAVLVGGAETVVRLATQPHEPRTGPLDLEQTRRPLVERSARLAARLVADPRSIGETTAHVVVPMVVATFGRQPFRPMAEIMGSQCRGHEVVDGLGGQG